LGEFDYDLIPPINEDKILEYREILKLENNAKYDG
jgi:hypothetical protein